MWSLRKFVIGVILTLSFVVSGLAFSEVPKRLLVLNKGSNDLSILDPETFKVLGTVPVGVGPHEVVISEDGKTAYATNYGTQIPGNTISIIDIPSMKETKRLDLGALHRPHGIQIINGNVYISVESNKAIARYNPKKDAVDWVMGTGQHLSHMVAGSPDELMFFTPNIGSNNVTAFRLAAPGSFQAQAFQIPVGRQPEAIGITPDASEVWIGLNQDNGIDVINTSTRKVTNRIDLGARPYRVVVEPNGKKAYATIFATKEVVEIDTKTKKILRRLVLENRAFGITFSKNGKSAFVTTFQQDGVVEIDLESFKVVKSGIAGVVPDGVAVNF